MPRVLWSAVFALCLAAGDGAGAAPAAPAAPVLLPPAAETLGQPHRFRFTLSPLAGYDRDREEGMMRAALTVSAEPGVPQFGLAQMSFALHGGTAGGAADYGLGASLKIPWVHAGVEYNIPRHAFVPLLALEFSPRRGGLLHAGDLVRIEVRPWDGQVLAGLTLMQPLHRYRRTRPLRTYVALPEGGLPAAAPPVRRDVLPRDLEAALEAIEHAVLWMDRLLTPSFETGPEFEESAALYRSHIRAAAHTFAGEDSTYHRELERAFALAAQDDVRGRPLARRAEAILLDRVLLPFDRCFAAIKKPATLGGLAGPALQEFDDYLTSSAARGEFSAEDFARAHEVFRRTLEAIDRTARTTHRRWDQKIIFLYPEARLVWLPLNYGLRPEQTDTQAEWDALTARVTGARVTDANRIEYLINEQFHLRLKEMLRETQSYQVLLVHDVRGRYRGGFTDRIGWDLVTDGYLRAFTEAVEAIDRGERRRLPQFFLFLDENYYEENRSREIVSYLERLYDPQEELELADRSVEGAVQAAQRALRRAIAASPSFRDLPERGLERLFRVQVNITYPFDPSFSGDAVLRDHRKVAFRDVFEDDPGAGCGLATGQGVGEHYNGTGWDDRGLLVQGPALLTLKTAARELFLNHGRSADQVPWCLRARHVPEDLAEQCRALRERGWTTPVAVVLNEVGYGLKQATVTKAFQYNLAPPGSTLLTYDSLWISDYWAGMLVAAALRGVNVVVMAPGPGNAPSSATPTLVLLRENLSRLVQASRYFAQEMAAAGGSLSVGVYDTRESVRDPRARSTAFLATWEREATLRKRFGLDAAALRALQHVQTETTAVAGETEKKGRLIPIESAHPPFLHMKVQFLASAEQMARLKRPEWATVLEDHTTRRRLQMEGATVPALGPDMLRPLAADTSGVVSLLVGSLNQDRRGMLLDGEVLVAVSGSDALTAAPDLLLLLGCASWPKDEVEFSRVFPEIAGPGFLRRLFRFLKDQI